MKSGPQGQSFSETPIFAVKFSDNPGHCRHRKIMLQTWKVASQQCESYGWDRLFIYRDKYGLASSSHVWFPDLGDNLGDKFGDEIWDLKGAGIFSIFLLGEEILLNVLEDSM
ncbi:hypothetical protein AVEN_100961-1 [Araneus ventricosus]|uniref:Uncharacterized protein n=1 Tax=Araneus ventricosus TaxID=182803 RepID=A0A4Y2RLW9_ARAVE|nr:hypothetical protein AVEN_70539-1 [Araneus ventricosus]GBN76400.1 hypothetical protein AVEN_100961-1 [Araneus ventricosus]